LQDRHGFSFDLHMDSLVSSKAYAFDGMAGISFAW
jgi:hypothetical protein